MLTVFLLSLSSSFFFFFRLKKLYIIRRMGDNYKGMKEGENNNPSKWHSNASKPQVEMIPHNRD